MTLPLFPRASQPHRSSAALASLAASLSLATGCVKRLPPAPTPEPVVPRLEAAASPAGGGRLIVDVVEGPAPVQRVRLAPMQMRNAQGRVSYQFVERPEPLCPVTPCAADLSGNVLLGFPVIGKPGALEVDLVHVGPESTVYRRALSIHDDPSRGLRVFGIVGTSFGGTAVMTGSALLPIGLAKDVDGLTLAGSISLGAGAALLAVGIWAIRRGSVTYRPGSSNHYQLAPSPSARR